MKTISTVRKLTGALLAGVALMLFGTAANAAQTASGTTISNSATVNYSVNSVAQSAITSTAATFKVDTQIVISVARSDSSKVAVTPGQTTAAVLTFTVTNNGNATEDVKLAQLTKTTGTADPFGGGTNDNFDGASAAVFVESGGTAGYQSAQDTATNIISLAAGGVKTVYVVITGSPAIPATQLDGDVAVYALTGTASVAGSCSTTCTVETQDVSTDKNLNTTNLNTVYKVFADAAGAAGDGDVAKDGIGSARDAFVVQSAKLTISKTSKIISDPIDGTDNGTTIHARAIPGAIIQYTITVANAAGAQTATGVAITDALTSQIPASTAWVTGQLNVTSPAGTISGCQDNGSGKTTTAGVSCDYNFTTPTTVTVTGISLTASQSATVTYEVSINQ